MGDTTSQEVTKKYLRQIGIAVAALLILYGALHLLNILSDLTNVSFSPYLWILFQLALTILIIFIGLRIYSAVKSIRQANLAQFWREAHRDLLVNLLGFIALLPVFLHPLPSSSTIFTRPFQPYSVHNPISFSYQLDYRWNYQNGGSILMFTVRSYPYSPFEIFVDVVPTSHGWIVVPYKIGIDPSKPILHWVTPAMVEVVLGLIENGDYTFKVMMKNSTDIFQIHKADSEFWVEEVKALMGSVAQKSEFEKRLDGFTITYGWAESNEIRLHALDLIKEANGDIVDASIPEYPNPISIRFYFNDSFDKLSNIVLDLAKQYPNSSISIRGNDRHFSSTYTYAGTIFVLPEYADATRSLIRRCGLVIYNEEIYETYSIEQGLYTEFIEIHISSASIEKTFSTIRSEIIERIQNELGLTWGFNNHFLVSP